MTTNPLKRNIGRGYSNLGNTCYMNAVLQALAHAPELCLAMDCESHQCTHQQQTAPTAFRKSRRTKSPETTEENSDTAATEFCALCAVEQQLNAVHEDSDNSPVAPNAFVQGFIDHVAPWFQLGLQEDSHEFLRLLIDAMQKSCVQARDDPNKPDDEYPFSLFRGTVESNVICGSCGASSITRDPIEDIGLDCCEAAPNTATTGSSSSRRASSQPLIALPDVQTAFQRFAKKEELDSGYKCEKCGKVGRATKQTKLASIPPILTLHLKRFRYGDSRTVVSNASRRSELNQLLGPGDGFAGKSGSAKIEGHIKFDALIDLKPYLTEELKEKEGTALCRLFAVVVHSGKNSHSGHYYSYVRNLTKNEWWKMDDGRTTLVSTDQVMNAEAYMLFYRVVKHPISVALEERYKGLLEGTTVRQEATPVKEKKEEVLESPLPKKRPHSIFSSGEEWARLCTSIEASEYAIFRKAQEYIADDVTISADYYQSLKEEAARDDAKIGNGPKRRKIQEKDVSGSVSKLRDSILNAFWRLSKRLDGDKWIKRTDRATVVEPDEGNLL